MAKTRRRVSAARRLKEHKSGYDRTAFSIPKDMKLLQLKSEGTKRFEIIPYTVPEEGRLNKFADAGQEHYELTFYVHKSIGINQDSYVCPAKTAGKKCPICEFRQSQRKDKDADEELIKDLAPKERQLWLLLDHANSDEGIMLFECSHHLFGKQVDEAVNNGDEEDGYEFFADAEDGLTLKCLVKEGHFAGRAFYSVEKVDFKTRREDLESELFDHDIVLDDLLIVPEYDTLKKIFLQIEDDDDGKGGEDEEESPKARRARKRKEADEEGEGQGDEEEETPKQKRARKRKEAESKEDEEEEGQGDEEEKPPKGPRASKKTAKKKTSKKSSKQEKYAVGTKVTSEIDGKDYTGEITSCPPDGDEVQITFEDGDVLMIPTEDVELPETKTDDEDESPKGSKKKTGKKGKKSKNDDEDWDDGEDWDAQE